MPPLPPRFPLLVLVLIPLAACRSNAPREPAPIGKPEPYVPLPDEPPETIGFFLTRFDRNLQQWSQLKLELASLRDQSALEALEANMQKRSRERRDDLIQELETGAPVNRRIAAAALGFTHDPTVLGSLLATLSDRDPELVQKALLGIGVLALPETPTGDLLRCLRDPDAWTRNNAAFALLALARAGNDSPELAEGCRQALVDSEPGVRAQCASALGELADPATIEPLSHLLEDEASLVSLAGAAALANIGRHHPEQKGTVARLLAQAFDRAPAERQVQFHGALRWLSEKELGPEASAWLEWAARLP